MKLRTRLLASAAGAAMLVSSLPLGAFAEDSEVVEGSFTFSKPFTSEIGEDVFYYSDDYFAESSYTDNAHRTSMSMVLALAASLKDSSESITKVYTDTGFEDISIEDIGSTPTRDTIGTAIAHRSVDGGELVAVAIRGDKYESEWASNLIAGSEGDTKGFSDAADIVLGRVRDYISDNGLKDVKLWISGYSRAGAVADLMGKYINGHLDEFGTAAEDVYVYTFEAPAASAEKVTYDNIRNIMNRDDLIPLVYPENWGLCHCGQPQWIAGGKTVDIKYLVIGEDGSLTVPSDGTMSMEDFNKEFIDFLSSELSRKDFSGEFDSAVADVLEAVFSKTDEEKQAVLDYFSGLGGSEGESEGSITDTLTKYGLDMVLDNDLRLLLNHTSDSTYARLESDVSTLVMILRLKTIIDRADLPLTDEDYDAVTKLAALAVRKLGPIAAKDLRYHDGKGCEDYLPEGFYDPEYDPNTDTYTPGEGFLPSLKEAYDLSLAADAENKAMPIYHLATLFGNIMSIIEAHYPVVNWEYVKQLDTYYYPEEDESSEEEESSSQKEDSSSEAEEESSSEAESKTESEAAPESTPESAPEAASSEAPAQNGGNPATGIGGAAAALIMISAAAATAARRKQR